VASSGLFFVMERRRGVVAPTCRHFGGGRDARQTRKLEVLIDSR
jgi:hypothetical protein